jgi:hypothetical protein
MRTKKKIYRVAFVNEGEVWEVYCKRVTQGSLFGFIDLEEFLFGEKSTVVVDPSEDKLKRAFDGVQRTSVPMHAIVRIDEVEKQGSPSAHAAKDGGAKVVTLPSSLRPPGTRR